MKFLLIIGFLFSLSVTFSAPINHFGVTKKKEHFKANDVKFVSVDVFSYDSVDFNYSSVATLTEVYNVRFFSNVSFVKSYLVAIGFNPKQLDRNKGSPIK